MMTRKNEERDSEQRRKEKKGKKGIQFYDEWKRKERLAMIMSKYKEINNKKKRIKRMRQRRK